MVLKGCFHVAAYLCRLYESNIFGARAVLGMDASHIFPQSVLVVIPLIWICHWCVVTRACTGCWAGPLLCSMAVIALSEAQSASQLLEWKLWGSDLIRLYCPWVCALSLRMCMLKQVRPVCSQQTYVPPVRNSSICPGGPPSLWRGFPWWEDALVDISSFIAPS